MSTKVAHESSSTTKGTSLAASVSQLAVSEKTVHVTSARRGSHNGTGTKQQRHDDGLRVRLRFKDCYIIRGGDEEADYTGLRVWPGAELLAHDMHKAGKAGALEGLYVCELGAGVGLSGLVAAHYAQRTIITDRVPAVLELIDENIALNELQQRACSFKLEWGRESAKKMREGCNGASQMWWPRNACIIAADVVYPDIGDVLLDKLFATVDALLRIEQSNETSLQHSAVPECQPASTSASSSFIWPFPLSGSFLCSYVNRDPPTALRLLLAAHRAGFNVRLVNDDDNDQIDDGEKQQNHPTIAMRTDDTTMDLEQRRAFASRAATTGVLLMFRKREILQSGSSQKDGTEQRQEWIDLPNSSTVPSYAIAQLRAHRAWYAVKSVESSSTSEDSSSTHTTTAPSSLMLMTPAFIFHPRLMLLWHPSPSAAEAALDELDAATGEEMLAAIGMDSSDDNEDGDDE